VDQRGEIMANPGLLAAQGAMAAIKQSRLDLDGKSYCLAQTFP
jgi:hypothetical protein